MIRDTRQNLLDAMAVLSLMLGVANYGENLDQTGAGKMLDEAVQDIHDHLAEQDRKIDKILRYINNDNSGNF